MALGSPLTIVITYTAPDVTGPVETRKPIITGFTVGGSAFAALSAAEVRDAFILMRDGAALLTHGKAPAAGIDSSAVT